MKWAVISVEPTKDYKLFLTFEGGKKRVFDFTPLLEDKINEPLRDINYFMTAKVHHHTVMWNEKLDVCPEYLFHQCYLRCARYDFPERCFQLFLPSGC